LEKTPADAFDGSHFILAEAFDRFSRIPLSGLRPSPALVPVHSVLELI
jgi:hypothetical protein